MNNAAANQVPDVTPYDAWRNANLRNLRQRSARLNVDVLAERTPCNYPSQWHVSRKLRLRDGALNYTTAFPAFDVPGGNGHTHADRTEIERLTLMVFSASAKLAALLGGEAGHSVSLRASQIRESVRRGSGIKVEA